MDIAKLRTGALEDLPEDPTNEDIDTAVKAFRDLFEAETEEINQLLAELKSELGGLDGLEDL